MHSEPSSKQGTPLGRKTIEAELNKGEGLSPFLTWCKNSKIEVKRASSGWRATRPSSIEIYPGENREQAAAKAATAEGLETYDEWRLRLLKSQYKQKTNK